MRTLLPKYKAGLAGFLILLFGLDQLTKWLFFSSGFGKFLDHLRPVIGNQLFKNYDFAFSLKVPHLAMYVLYAFLLAALALYYFQRKDKNLRFSMAVGLVMVGALGNLLDRALLGYVRDFIYIFWGNIFNFADIYIVAGIIMLLIKD